MSTTLALPTVEEEVWRYSRIGELDLANYRSATATTTVENSEGVQLAGSEASALMGVAITTAPDVFAQMNTDNAAVIALKIAKGKVHATTVVITHTINESGVVVYPRLVIDAAENSEITVVERFVSADNVVSLVVPVVEIHAAQ